MTFVAPTRAVEPGTVAVRWDELAAEHSRETCPRCRPPAKAESVADLVRRLRREAAPERPAAKAAIDLMSDLRHVAAAAVDDQPRQAMRIADDIAPRDLGAAASFAAALPTGRAQNAAMITVVGIWVRADRRAALEWAQALAEEPARHAALQEIARRLVTADVREAQMLAAGLPEGPGRGDALCAVARQWSKIDRPAALSWVRSFVESADKARMLEAIAE